MIFFSLAEAPLANSPNIPKRTRNGPETDLKQTETDLQRTRNGPRSSSLGWDGGGFVGTGGGGAVREKDKHYSNVIQTVAMLFFQNEGLGCWWGDTPRDSFWMLSGFREATRIPADGQTDDKIRVEFCFCSWRCRKPELNLGLRLGSPRPSTEPKTPETPKSLQKSLPRGLWDPRDPQKSSQKSPKSPKNS